MHIFLDESGDLGFDFINKKPSTHFVITLLVCSNRYSVLRFKAAVQHTLKRKLNNNKNRLVSEIKSTQTNLSIKKYFYNNISLSSKQGDWGLYSIVIDKKALLSHTNTPPNSHRLYNVLAHNVLKQIDFSTVDHCINLSVDKCKPPKERMIFDTSIQNNLEAQLPIDVTLNIEHETSHCSTGLQAVDLFCWGIFRKYAYNDTGWYDVFKKQIIWEGEYKC